MSSPRSRPAPGILRDLYCARGNARIHQTDKPACSDRTSCRDPKPSVPLDPAHRRYWLMLAMRSAVPHARSCPTQSSPRCASSDQDRCARRRGGARIRVYCPRHVPMRCLRTRGRFCAQDIAIAALSPHRAFVETSNQSKSNRKPPRRHPPTRSLRRACQQKSAERSQLRYFGVNKKGNTQCVAIRAGRRGDPMPVAGSISTAVAHRSCEGADAGHVVPAPCKSL